MILFSMVVKYSALCCVGYLLLLKKDLCCCLQRVCQLEFLSVSLGCSTIFRSDVKVYLFAFQVLLMKGNFC